MRTWTILGAMFLTAGVAFADEPQAPAAVDAVPAPAPTAWDLYEQAFAAAAAGNDAQALSLVTQLRMRFPGSGAALLGSELGRLVESKQKGAVQPEDPNLKLLLLEKLEPPVPVAPPARRPARDLAEFLRDEKPTRFARGELAFWQTVNGVGIGIETCFILECNDVRPTIVSALLGGGLGAGAALWFSQDGITPGHTLAIDSGTAWGFWHGLALSNIFDVDGKAAAGIFASAQLAGTLVGHLAWTAFPVGAGDVSLANSGGIWAGVLTMWIDFIAGGSQSTKAFFASVLVGSDVGLLGGALASRLFPMSRGRTFIIDAGALLGMLLGMGLEVLIAGNADSAGAFGGAAIAGMLTGLGTAGYLTRNWDLEDAPDLKVGFAPVPGGGGMFTAMLVH